MKKIIYSLIAIITLVLFSLTFRGNMGVPSPNEIDLELSNTGQAFETSQERARFASILSLYYDKSIIIDNYASMATPDIGRLNGHYYSLFPPTISFMALPFYAIGLYFGATQMAVFAFSTVFSILTMILIVKFCLKLGLHWAAAAFSALSFGFATNAWGYSVTLYAHIVSAFFILAGLYFTLTEFKRFVFLRNTLVWFMYGVAVYIDYPNIFIYLPIVILLTMQGVSFEEVKEKIKVSFDWRYIITPFIFVAMLGGYGYYNYINFGSPMQFSNALPRVQDLKDAARATPENQKNNGQVLKSRNMLEGIRTFTVSLDRGVLFYSPIVLLSVLGIGYLTKKRKLIEVGLVSVPLVCFVLYIMFGDPYGGWAFGSRYLLAIFPPLCILAGIGLQKYVQNIYIKLLYSAMFIYSTAISLLAPLTTNVIPPEVEATGLGLKSNFSVAIDMLHRDQLNSFVFNNMVPQFISGQMYYFFILTLIVTTGLTTIWMTKRSEHKT